MEADDGVCYAPDGTPQLTFGFGPKGHGRLILFILACTPLALIIIVPRLLFFVGRTLGTRLQNKTAARKAAILKQTEDDEMAYLKPEEARRNSDDWEDVDAYTTGTAKNGEKADPEWDGIVGFLHPFW
jgi:alpha-1,2-mannosyltransferase